MSTDLNLEPPTPSEPPRMAGIRLGPGLGMVLYVLLAAAAVLAFFGRQFPGRLPGFIERTTPFVFGVFLAGFGFYRFGLVAARKYPAFKAFFQVGLAVAVFLLLLPSSRHEYAEVSEGLAADLQDLNPRVRALAAEVAGGRREGARYVPALMAALEDPDPRVRMEAHRSLVRLTGKDLGSPEDPEGIRAWRKAYP